MADRQVDDDYRDPWDAEAEAMGLGLSSRDYDVADSAELPADLIGHAEAADLDPEFDELFAEWLAYAHDWPDCGLLLAVEQCCHQGMLLPRDMLERRLESLPTDVHAGLHKVLQDCPRHVLVHLVHYVYWVVRSERARRRGSPDWGASMEMPPLTEDEKDWASRPMK